MSPSDPRRTIRIFPGSAGDLDSRFVSNSVWTVPIFIPVCCARCSGTVVIVALPLDADTGRMGGGGAEAARLLSDSEGAI